MDIEQKKIDLKEDIAGQPATLVLARIAICDEVQLSDLMKTQFTPYFRGSAGNVIEETAQLHSNTTVDLQATAIGRVIVGMTVSGANIPASTTVATVVSNTRITISNAATNSAGNVELTFGHPHTLHGVCTNLAKQRALLQGAAVGDIINFNIAATSTYTTNGTLTFPQFEDSTQGNKTTFPFIVLHDFNEVGGQITLSTTTNANTTIADDEGNNIKYFTDFSKYFLTRSRANGELISVDENTSPYMSPSVPEPFLPPNTINGGAFLGTAAEPTANSDVRYEYSLVANSEPIAGGHIGGGYDLAEDYYTGNTYVWMEMSNVVGTFAASEELLDFANNTSTIKSSANTSTVLLETFDTVGTFVTGELLTDRATNAAIFSTQVGSDTEVNITLTGSTFDTGANTDITLGFPISTTITLDTNSISRSGSTVTVETTDEHGILSGERIVLKGADDVFDEFNGIFEVDDTTANTLTFTTANTGSVIPTGNFSMVKGIVFGRTSNASGAVRVRTVNATANVIFQSANLDVGFAIANTVTGTTSGATGVIDSRNKKGDWYKVRDKQVKVFNSGTGTWTIDAAANTGEFWNKNFEPVRISTIIPTSGTGSNTVAAKMKLTKALATSGDTSGGYDSTVVTKLPGTYFAYPLKTWDAQVHSGVTTLEAFDNFANVVIAPEGLEVNFDWLPLGTGNDGTNLNQNGTVQTAAHNPEEATTLDKTEFESKLGSYGSVAIQNAAGNFPNAPDDVFLSSIPANRSSANKTDNANPLTNTYPNKSKNPFYPAVGGTHKTGPGPGITANTSDGITGTQPGGLDANSIYAGSYTEVQKGALDPPAQTTPQTIKMDNRYIVQNDLKWVYATDPFCSTSTAASSDNKTPQTASYQEVYDGFTKSGGQGARVDSIRNQTITTHTATALIPADSATRTSGTGSVIASTPPTLSANSVSGFSSGTSTTFNFTDYGNVHTEPASGTVDRWVISTISSGKVTTLTKTHTTTDVTYDTNSSGTTTNTYRKVVEATTGNTQNYTLNMAQDVLNHANTSTFIAMVTTLQGNDTTYGAAYVDPNEPASGTIITDTVFETAVDTMKEKYDKAVLYHNNHGYTNGAAHTYDTTNVNSGTMGSTPYATFLAAVTTFKGQMQQRIREITNRIGYLNGKAVDNGGSGTTVSNHNTAGHGFAGYTFNNGKGYANTVYSHANFLAGKKIKLIAKILGAVEDVDAIYTQIQGKRSEYYEYNQ